MTATELEHKKTLHDVAIELATLRDDMEKMRKSLLNVGLASIADNIRHWQDRIERAQGWL